MSQKKPCLKCNKIPYSGELYCLRHKPTDQGPKLSARYIRALKKAYPKATYPGLWE